MKAQQFCAVRKVLSRGTGGAERSEVGIGFDGGAEKRFESGGGIDTPAGLGQVAPLAGVAAEIELDRGLAGVAKFGLAENRLGLRQRAGAAGGVGERDPGLGVGGLAPDEFAGDAAEFDPVALLAENHEPELEDLVVAGGGRRELIEFGGGFGEEAELDVAASVGKEPARLHGDAPGAAQADLSRQHCLYLRPLPQGQGSLRPGLAAALTGAGPVRTGRV